MHGCVRLALAAAGGCLAIVASPAASAGAALRETPPKAEISNSPRKGFTYAQVVDGGAVGASRKPGASPYRWYGSSTEMGSPRHLSVVKVRRNWLGVAPTLKRNGRIVWIRRDDRDVRFVRTMYSVHVDLSSRALKLRHGTKTTMTTKVAIGRPGSTTPTGRFAITDKLNGRKLSSYYGCCVLALNGHQPNLPAGWRGGSRLAIHGTDALGSIGTAASAGCVRASDGALRVLMRRLPIGTPVFVRR